MTHARPITGLSGIFAELLEKKHLFSVGGLKLIGHRLAAAGGQLYKHRGKQPERPESEGNAEESRAKGRMESHQQQRPSTNVRAPGSVRRKLCVLTSGCLGCL